MTRFDPTNWIDTQRAAGNARGNVFADILAASEQKRGDNLSGYDARLDQRRDRVRDIKLETARFDATGDRASRAKIPTFNEITAQHEGPP